MARLGDALAYLASFYPRQKIEPGLMVAYAAELADIPVEAVWAAVRESIRTSPFWPSVAELRALAAEHRLGLPGDAGALAQVDAYLRASASRQRVECGRCAGVGDTGGGRCIVCGGQGEVWDKELPVLDPVVRQALDLVGGAYDFRNHEKPSVIRAQFLQVYRGLRDQAVRDERVGELPAGRQPLGLAPGVPAVDLPGIP